MTAELPSLVSTARLRMPLVTLDERADMLSGRRRPGWHPDYPRKDDVDATALIRDGDTWGPRHLVRAFDGLVFGSIGFFGPPDGVDGVPEAEVGYGVVAEARGHGLTTEALRGLLAETDRLRIRVRATVVPENRASVRVLAKCGFTELRGANEDGELVMARPLPRVEPQ